MSPGDWASLFFASSLALSVTSAGLLVAWLHARERAVRAEMRLEHQERPARSPHIDGPLGDIDAIAAEVARIGEGHEFLVQLLRERSAVPARSVAHPVISER